MQYTLTPFLLMPVLKTSVDDHIKTLFRMRARAHGQSESEFLRTLILPEIGGDKPCDGPVRPDPQNTALKLVAVRLPGFVVEAARERAGMKGMALSRWIAALVQSNLMRIPVMSGTEITALQENSRELAAIGRNISRMARTLNEAGHQTERVRLDALIELGEAIKANRDAISAAVRASRNAWEAK